MRSDGDGATSLYQAPTDTAPSPFPARGSASCEHQTTISEALSNNLDTFRFKLILN